MSYSELTRRYFEAAPCAGVLEGTRCVRGAAGHPTQGTWVQFDVEFDRGGERIERARFRAFGCPHVIAIAAWVAEQASGRAPEARLPESAAALRERFDVPVEKLGRLLIVEDAWAAVARAAARWMEARAAQGRSPEERESAVREATGREATTPLAAPSRQGH
jgi:NifU-like protein involved in Fe-S cluster formation